VRIGKIFEQATRNEENFEEEFERLLGDYFDHLSYEGCLKYQLRKVEEAIVNNLYGDSEYGLYLQFRKREIEDALR
jgi:hypothetical protein